MLDGAPFESRVTLPPTTSLRQARAGDYIKVGRRRERFWARVGRVGADGSIVATVDNELVLNPDLPLGVVIEVSREHVLEICSSEDEELVVEGIRAASRTGVEDATTHAILGWWETRSVSARRDCTRARWRWAPCGAPAARRRAVRRRYAHRMA